MTTETLQHAIALDDQIMRVKRTIKNLEKAILEGGISFGTERCSYDSILICSEEFGSGAPMKVTTYALGLAKDHLKDLEKQFKQLK